MSSSAENKKIMLRSSDGETFEVDEVVAVESQPIKHMIEDECADTVIPLPNVTSQILSKVIEYCKKHVEANASKEAGMLKLSDDDLKKWDQDFASVDRIILIDLILASHYLNIKGLLDLTCQTMADMIKGKKPEEICKMLNIKNELTPEEEEEVRRENQWAWEFNIKNVFTPEEEEEVRREIQWAFEFNIPEEEEEDEWVLTIINHMFW